MNEEKIVNGLKSYIDQLDKVESFQDFTAWKNAALCFLVDVYGEKSQQKKSLFNIGFFETYEPSSSDVSILKRQARTLLEGLVLNIGFTDVPQS